MGRSKKKGPFVDPKLYRKVELMDAANKKDPIKTWARACTIVPEFVGHTFMVHNGKLHVKVFVTEDMVGHRLGEFSPTRTFRGHGGRMKKEAEAAAAAAGCCAARKVTPCKAGMVRRNATKFDSSMGYKATHRFARISARKVRPLADLVRGKYADERSGYFAIHAAPRSPAVGKGDQKRPGQCRRLAGHRTSAAWL